jgi:hypothetical protein
LAFEEYDFLGRFRVTETVVDLSVAKAPTPFAV